jgi:hypothetical protein
MAGWNVPLGPVIPAQYRSLAQGSVSRTVATMGEEASAQCAPSLLLIVHLGSDVDLG